MGKCNPADKLGLIIDLDNDISVFTFLGVNRRQPLGQQWEKKEDGCADKSQEHDGEGLSYPVGRWVVHGDTIPFFA